jgi:hypothetical protein
VPRVWPLLPQEVHSEVSNRHCLRPRRQESRTGGDRPTGDHDDGAS